MEQLTHFDESGRAKMVDVSAKANTVREAIARGNITVKPETLALIAQGKLAKGDVLGVAQVAGIMGAKQTPHIIPMCHPLLLSGVKLNFHLDMEHNRVDIEARVKTTGKTGVEMEALTAVAIAGLTIYDMCKAVDKDMIIGEICLVEKLGGKSGHYLRSNF
ncbi:MAG TPA: cyclic pyranopterin monophosphate synthase MoaC [Desulfobacteria bacterium]|nr:cyclic pyranopterin monophosphate synthase MoaC [Desulfobacteria bacterium]